MSASYAARLRQDVWKGKCGDSEYLDTPQQLQHNVEQLAKLLNNASYAIVHTGAGVSTVCGIPDFRGPDGVWTRELQNRPQHGQLMPLDQIQPSLTHRSLTALLQHGLIKHVVTQNVDGLHVKAGIPRDCLSEIHGTMFAEHCDICDIEIRRETEVPDAMGFKLTGNKCQTCNGPLRDKLCDWDTPLPEEEMETANAQHRKADFVLVMGSSLRIRPAGNMPLKTKRRNGKAQEGDIVIVNLQKTHLDSKCTLRLFSKCDDVMKELMRLLKIPIPEYPASTTTEDSNTSTQEPPLKKQRYDD